MNVNRIRSLSRSGETGGEVPPVLGHTEPPARAAVPLIWPQRFPPSDWWGRFFTGIPPLGPSVGFFRQLEREQASRTSWVMVGWGDLQERRIALRLGQCLKTLGWKTPFFIPSDQLLAVIGGPSFVSYAQQDLAYLLDEFNRRFERHLEPEYLRSAVDWSDGTVSFGDLVARVRAELERKAFLVTLEGADLPSN